LAEMKAAIERALGTAAQTSTGSEKCQEANGDSQWLTSMGQFRRKRSDQQPSYPQFENS